MTDQETLKSLQEQVRTLQNHLNPTQDPEQLLDDLYLLQQKRHQEIHNQGITVSFGASEKSFKCLRTTDENIVYFPAGTNVTLGGHIKSGSDLIGIITSITAQAGRIKADIWTPKQTAQEFTASITATGENLKQTGLNVPCKLEKDTLTFFNKSFPAGSILKCSCQFFEVIGSYSEKGLFVHQVKSYNEPQTDPNINRQVPIMITGSVVDR